MKRLALVLFALVLVLNVTNVCFGDDTRHKREVLKIKIIDKGDDEPKVIATIHDKPSGPRQSTLRRSYMTPYRNFYRSPISPQPYALPQTYNPYSRNHMHLTSTAYSPSELAHSLGTLVNSILASRVKHPINKIYIVSKHNHDVPHSEPVYHVYQEQRPSSDPNFIPSTQIQPSEIVVKPSVPPDYATTLDSHRPIAVATLGADYHLPKVTELIEDKPPESSVNLTEQLKEMQKSVKRLVYKPTYGNILPKSTQAMNEKVRAYNNFMKRPEYFLPKVEPDHHTEPTNYDYTAFRHPSEYEIRPSALPLARHVVRASRRESPHHHQHHAFVTHNLEFTPSDAIRTHPAPLTSSEEDVKYRVYESDRVSSRNSFSNKNAKRLSEHSIRQLESKRYIVPRDCTSRCLEENKKNYDPVCGSDERTYLNEEMLLCLSACREINTEMDYQGPCN